MTKEKFLLVSLEEDKSKKLAQAISNESCRKILDHLADKDATESELSEKLGIPISTVHYNLQQLMNSGLVKAEEFHYSKKGREVLHYKLANKYIIIAPKTSFNIKKKLKSILPVALFGLIGATAIELYTRFSGFKAVNAIAQDTVQEGAPQAMRTLAKAGGDIAAEEAEVITHEVSRTTVDTIISNYTFWFLMGCIFTILIIIIVEFIIYKRNNR